MVYVNTALDGLQKHSIILLVGGSYPGIYKYSVCDIFCVLSDINLLNEKYPKQIAGL